MKTSESVKKKYVENVPEKVKAGSASRKKTKEPDHIDLSKEPDITLDKQYHSPFDPEEESINPNKA